MGNISDAFKIINALKDKNVIKKIEDELDKSTHKIDEEKTINVVVNAIIKRIEQMRLKSIDFIDITCDSYETPLPPNITIISNGNPEDIELFLLKSKELRCELDAYSADFNIEFANDKQAIREAYNQIAERLQQWSSKCKTFSNFNVKLNLDE